MSAVRVPGHRRPPAAAAVGTRRTGPGGAPTGAPRVAEGLVGAAGVGAGAPDARPGRTGGRAAGRWDARRRGAGNSRRSPPGTGQWVTGGDSHALAPSEPSTPPHPGGGTWRSGNAPAGTVHNACVHLPSKPLSPAPRHAATFRDLTEPPHGRGGVPRPVVGVASGRSGPAGVSRAGPGFRPPSRRDAEASRSGYGVPRSRRPGRAGWRAAAGRRGSRRPGPVTGSGVRSTGPVPVSRPVVG